MHVVADPPVACFLVPPLVLAVRSFTQPGRACAGVLRPLLPPKLAWHTRGSGGSKARWGSGLQKWVTDRLITRIVDSLQIHVREVHVRYEVCG